MDGVSLAESLLYKDCDELQRLIKGCSITDNQNTIRSSINASLSDKGGNCTRKCENLSYKYGCTMQREDYELQKPTYGLNSNNYEEPIETTKSLLGEPVQGNTVSNLLFSQNSSFLDQATSKDDLRIVSHENMKHPLGALQKSTDNQILVNSASLDPYVPQQSMISTFKLNAELPIVNTRSSTYNELDSYCDNSRLFNQRTNSSIFSVYNKMSLNGAVVTLSNHEAQFPALPNKREDIGKMAPNNCRTISGDSSNQTVPSIYYINNSNLDGNHKVEQSVRGSPNIFSNIRVNNMNKEEMISRGNSLRTAISNFWHSNHTVLPKSSSNKEPINTLAHNVMNNNTHYALEPNKQEIRNPPIGQAFEDAFDGVRLTRDIPFNTVENLEALVSSANNSKRSTKQLLLETSKGNKYQMKTIPPDSNSMGRSCLINSLPSEASGLKKPSGSHLPYQKMCEQHCYLRNDLEKIISSLAPNSSKLEETTSHYVAGQVDLESEILQLCSSYEKTRNLMARFGKLRPGTIPNVIITSLENFLTGIRKLQLYSCALSTVSARDARERLTETNTVKPQFDLSNIGQTLLELTGQLRQLRTALWAYVQRFGWTGTSSYAQAVYALAELAIRGTVVPPLNNPSSSNLLNAPSLGTVVHPFKSVARPLMDLQTPLDVVHYPTAAVAPASGNNNSSSNSVTNQRSLVFIPGAAGTTNICWSPRHLGTAPSSTSRVMFTQPSRYVPDQIVIPDTSTFPAGQVGSVYSHGFLIPHTTTHPGQSALIMPSSFLTTNLGCSTNLMPHMCNLQSGTRLTDHL